MGLESDTESVQRRLTKMLPGLIPIRYNERQLCLQIESLKTRSSRRADLPNVCKLNRGQFDIYGDSVDIALSQVIHKARNNTVAKTFAYRVRKS